MFLLKFLGKRFAPKIRSDDLQYGNVVQRYASMLCDLAFMMMIVKLYQSCFMFVFQSWFNIDFEILNKARLSLILTTQEQSIIDVFKIHYLIMQFSQLVVISIYTIVCWYYLGGSFGQVLFGLRIVSDDGSKLSLKQIIIRLCSIILTLMTLMIGFLWSFIDKKRQSLHDKIARTIIVTKKSLKINSDYHYYDFIDDLIMPFIKKIYLACKAKLF